MRGPLDHPLPIEPGSTPSYDLPRVGQVYHLRHDDRSVTPWEVLHVGAASIVAMEHAGPMHVRVLPTEEWRRRLEVSDATYVASDRADGIGEGCY